MNILITGSSTILGSACVEFFFSSEHTLFLVDSLPLEKNEVESMLEKKTDGLDIDMVILTEGETLLDEAKTSYALRQKQKELLTQTSCLIDYISKKANKPQTLFLASSILIYGNDESQIRKVDENTPLHKGQGADFYQQLESLTKTLSDQNVRVISMRLGKIVSRQIEPVEVRMPFSYKFIPVAMGSNGQKISWISQEDTISAISFLLQNTDISGPVNFISGDFIPSTDYYTLIAQKFGLKRMIPLPLQLLRVLMGKELFSYIRNLNQAIPAKLMQAGFLFKDISLGEYLHGRTS